MSSPRKRLRKPWLVVAVGAFVTLGACQGLVDTSPQCDRDEDCARFERRACVQGVCAQNIVNASSGSDGSTLPNPDATDEGPSDAATRDAPRDVLVPCSAITVAPADRVVEGETITVASNGEGIYTAHGDLGLAHLGFGPANSPLSQTRLEVCDLTTLTIVADVAAVAVPNGPYRWRGALAFGAGPHQVRFYGKGSSDALPRPYAVATF